MLEGVVCSGSLGSVLAEPALRETQCVVYCGAGVLGFNGYRARDQDTHYRSMAPVIAGHYLLTICFWGLDTTLRTDESAKTENTVTHCFNSRKLSL